MRDSSESDSIGFHGFPGNDRIQGLVGQDILRSIRGGNDYLIYDTTTGSLYYDADGNGAGAQVEFVTLTGIPAITAADFSIV